MFLQKFVTALGGAFLLCFFLLAGPANASPFAHWMVRRPYSHVLFLGRTDNRRDYARVSLRPRNVGDQCELTITFESRHNNHVYHRQAIDFGESYASDVKFNAVPIVGKHRKELFVSIKLGRITTKVFSYINGKLITIYKDGGGRVTVYLWPERDGKYSLIEAWPLLQWEDIEPKGGATYITNRPYWTNGFVRRTLHWKGNRFVAEETMVQRRAVDKAVREMQLARGHR